jgi:hypothetical protein
MLDHINSLKTSMTLTRPYELLTMQVLSSTYCDIFTSFPPGTLHTQSLYFWALSNRLSKHFRHHDKQQIEIAGTLVVHLVAREKTLKHNHWIS